MTTAVYSSAANMNRWHGRVAIVTGASSNGIGAAICAVLVRAGLRVIGCARSHERIENLAQKLKEEGAEGQLIAKQCDLTQESEILHLFQQINTEYGGADILINNAGLAHSAPLFTGSTEQWDNMWLVNLRAPCITTREFFKSLKDRNIDDGHVIHVGSNAGHRIPEGAYSHFYSASKFALRALAEGHRREARKQLVNENKVGHNRVTLISPGVVETEFAERMMNLEIAKSYYTTLDTMKPEDIADAVIYALSAPLRAEVNDIIIRCTEQIQ